MPKGVKLSNKSEFQHKHLLSYMCYLHCSCYWAACEPVFGGGVCQGTLTQQVQNNIGPMNRWLLVKQQAVMPPSLCNSSLYKIKQARECAGFFGSICAVRKLSFCKNMYSFFPYLNLILWFLLKTDVPHFCFTSPLL